ncbi:glycosyltransferase family 39 protein [bacterium]|nr:glycosyltransferase family 39 protein [bacterium]
MTVDKRLVKTCRDISLIDIIVAYVSIVSIINVVLLSFEIFYPVLSLVLGVIVCGLIFLLFKLRINIRKVKSLSLFLLPIILIAIFLRLSPNLYLTGGQDQGTYVSLSKQYQENKSLYIKDELRESLSVDAKYYYDIGNVFAGVKEFDIDNSEYLMPFYPVFPSWMATFGEMFGSDNRVYALTMFSILSIVGMYLFSYEISGKNKRVGLLASFLLAINPLHVYFSRVPLTEIVSLTFFLFSFYYLMRFYRNWGKRKRDILSLVLSLVTINALFYTRMNAIFFIPIIVLIPISYYLFKKDKLLLKHLTGYSTIWILTMMLSFLYYKIFIPNLFNLVVGKRLLSYFDSYIIQVSFVLGTLLFAGLLSFRKPRMIMKKVMKFLYNKFFVIARSLFIGLILYSVYFYVREIFVDNSNSILSFNSLSYLKQLSFLTTVLYLSPIGFLLLPISFPHLIKKRKITISLLIMAILILLTYCWGVLRLTQYHYYFTRYQFSELIPLCLVSISIFLVDISKKRLGKWILVLFVVSSTLYMGFFSILQLRDYEGADKRVYEDLDSILGEEDLLFVANHGFESFDQIVLPMKYYYDMNVFPMYYLSYIEKEEFVSVKENYDEVYILTTVSNLERLNRDDFELVKVFDFRHNYFVHCLRSEDEYFEMIDHTKDIPLCEYMVIPNRFYYGSYSTFLFRWK